MKKVLDVLKSGFKKIDYNSPVILTFTVVSAIALLLGILTNGWSTEFLFSIHRREGFTLMIFPRMLAYVLGHANVDHYVGNILMILIVGPMLEEKYGSKLMLSLMVITALVTGVVSLAFFPDFISLGASGIVFAMIVLSSFVNYKKGCIPLTLIVCIVVFIGREIISGVSLDDNISHLSHILGGLAGAVFGYYIHKRKTPKDDVSAA